MNLEWQLYGLQRVQKMYETLQVQWVSILLTQTLAQQTRMDAWSCQHGMTDDHAYDITADITVTQTIGQFTFPYILL